jgi:fatty acid desaturase
LPSLSIPDATQAYSHIKLEARQAGIFDRSYGFYALLTAFAFVGYAASVAAIVHFDQAALIVLACLIFSFFSVQVAGLMHDSGHRAVFSSTTNNDILGYIAAGLLGMVFDNWKTRHNMHHAHPNQEDLDPDMEIPFIATSEEYYLKKGPLQRWLIRYQAYYYYPLGAIVSFSNRLGTITYFLKHGSLAGIWKVALYGCGVLFLFVSPFVAFAPEKALLVFLTVHVSTGIYLANCFAPNHKGMPQVGKAARLSFLEQQVITARNVRGGFFTDMALVGLNHQIEHHLFPFTPRNKLRLLQPYVRGACEQLGIEYTEVGLLETNKMLLRELRNVPQTAKLPLAQVQPAID